MRHTRDATTDTATEVAAALRELADIVEANPALAAEMHGESLFLPVTYPYTTAPERYRAAVNALPDAEPFTYGDTGVGWRTTFGGAFTVEVGGQVDVVAGEG